MELARLLRKETISGGALVARALAAEGVDTVFGIIDGTYVAMLPALGAEGIRLVTPRHETTAMHMAGAWARVTGRLGVALASNGPGVANVLPGVAVEHAEGNRVLLLTSCRREGIAYPDRGGTFQYFPQSQAIGAMCKWSRVVPSFDRLAELLRAALRACFAGRPGVVHLDVPESVFNGKAQPKQDWFRPPQGYRVRSPIPPAEADVAEVATALAGAQRPMIHAGSGVLHAAASARVHRLAELLEAPITTSWAARACVDERDERVTSMVYVEALRQVRNEADVAIVLGSRLGETDFWGKPPYWGSTEQLRTIQVDIDPETLGRNRPAEPAVQADIALFLDALIAELEGRGAGDVAARRPWLRALAKARRARRRKLDRHLRGKGMPMHPAHVSSTCRRLLPEDAVLVIDGGNTAIWGHFYWQVQTPGALVTTPKMGMLGAGQGHALGVKAALPDREVVCVIGDGAMGFHLQEIETAVRAELPVIWIVLADRQWGMVKMTQQFAYKPLETLIRKSLKPEDTVNADLGEIEFDVVARAMGAHGERVADPDGLEGAIERARASGRPAVIHVDVDRVAHLWAPELKTFKEMHQEPGG